MRKQTALKSATGYLTRIKKLLQAYALARPNVRLSLKVLKAKTDKGTFTYAPKHHGAGVVEDAALKVIGKECVSQCASTIFEADGLELQAFLPRPDADPTRISGVGTFISVDSRPVSATRGTLKQIVSKFKETIRKSHPKFESVKDPFLCLNIVCPSGSYDPNIEPAKDDVLFDDSEKVVKAVEKLLASVYSVLEEPNELLFDANDLVDKVNEKVTSLSRPHNASESTPMSKSFGYNAQAEDRSIVEDSELAFLEQRQATQGWRTNMYGWDDEDVDLSADGQSDPSSKEQQEAAEALRDVNISNPWTIARVAAGRKAITRTLGITPTGQHEEVSSIDSPIHGTRRDTRYQEELANPTLPEEEITERHLSNRGLLTVSNLAQTAKSTSLQSHPFQLPTPLPSSSPVYGTPLDSIPEATRRQRRPRAQGNVKTPYVDSVQPSPERNWFQFGPSSSSQRPRAAREGRSQDIRDFMVPNPGARSGQLVVQGEIDHIDRETSPALWDFNGQPGGHRLLRLADVNPYTQGVPENIHNVVPQENDIVAPRQHCKNGNSRMKSSMMPLEHVSEDAKTQDIIITLRLNPADISSCMSRLSKNSNRLKWSILPDSLPSGFSPLPEEEELERWCNRLRTYLHPILSAEDEFEDFREQTEEAFARLD